MVGKCKFCRFEENSKCAKKNNVTVKLNKRRQCEFFVVDESKARDFVEHREKNKIESVQVPSWYWVRDLRRKEIAKMKKEEMSQFATTAVASPTDGNHPLTGDLSRFSTTAKEN